MKASLNEHTKYNDKLSFCFMKIFFEWWICGNHFYNYFKAILFAEMFTDDAFTKIFANIVQLHCKEI